MSSPETFGYEPDENGDVRFVTIHSCYAIQGFQDYMDNWFPALVEVAEQNVGYMPIARFDFPPPKIPDDLYPEDKGNE